MKNSGLNKILLFNASRPGGIQGRAGKESRNQTFSPHLSSVQFSHSIMSDSLRPHGLQHTRLPCLSPTPRACSNSCPSNWRSHPNISPSVVPFSSCPLSFLASGSFPVNQFLASSGQSIGVSSSASVLPMNTQDWFHLGWTDAEAEATILWPPDVKNWLIGKDLDAGKDWGQEEKGTTEGEMVGWHHRLNGHGFGWTPGVGDGQGGLACCDSWGRKELDTTEWLNWTELMIN